MLLGDCYLVVFSQNIVRFGEESGGDKGWGGEGRDKFWVSAPLPGPISRIKALY